MLYRIKTLSLISTVVLLAAQVEARTLTVQMLGDATFIGDLPSVWFDVFDSMRGLPDDNAGFGCFSVSLVDPRTGKRIGTGIDCLRDLPGDNGPGLTAISIFQTGGGIIVNRGSTSLGLFSTGIGDAGGAVNLITGSIPTSDASSLIFGTGKFRDIVGRARVSGAAKVDFGSGLVEAFNCLWQIEIDGRDD